MAQANAFFFTFNSGANMQEKLFLVLSATVQAKRFNRSKRDEAGNELRKFEFVFGEPVEMTEEMLEAVADDIGNVLLIGTEQSPGVVKVDSEATDRLVLEIANAKLEAKAALTPVQKRAIDLFSVGREQPAPEPAKQEQSSEIENQADSEADGEAMDTPTEAEADLSEEGGRRRGRPKKNP